MSIRPSHLGAITLCLWAASAHAAFHVMQIEEVIGGVNGNSNAQAIQLRLRIAGQNVVSAARLKVYDRNGLNPVLLLDITSDVANSAAGANILLATPAFNTIMAAAAGYAPDFTLTNTIPVSYLSGGKVTFEDDFGTIYWALAFGNYTGTNNGDGTNTNGFTGNFGAPFSSALPTAGVQAIAFKGTAAAGSASNSTDYGIVNSPTVRRNNGSTFSVIPEPGAVAFLGAGTVALGALIFSRRRKA